MMTEVLEHDPSTASSHSIDAPRHDRDAGPVHG
jgi:hypothetical protein